MSHEVNWPGTEPIPQSIEEALTLGWKIQGSKVQPCEDEFTREGTADLSKKIGMIELYLTIPIRDCLTYGQPFDREQSSTYRTRSHGTLVPSPKIDTTALLSPYGAAAYILTARLTAEVQMRTWKTKHPFDWGLAIRISLLILATMAVLCVLLYSNYRYAR